MALALMTVSQNLRAYFQAHQVVVLTDQPLRQILHKLDMLGRLVKWVVKLGEDGLQYGTRPAIKGLRLGRLHN